MSLVFRLLQIAHREKIMEGQRSSIRLRPVRLGDTVSWFVSKDSHRDRRPRRIFCSQQNGKIVPPTILCTDLLSTILTSENQ